MTSLNYNKDISEFRIEKDHYAADRLLKTYAIHDYYGKNKFSEVDSDIQWVRRLIWQFKDGNGSVTVANKIAQAIQSKGLLLNNSCFMIIPASDPLKSSIRFRTFAATVCNKLGIKNSWDGITTVAHEATKGHADGNKIEYFTFHNSSYNGKTVYLFDDVCTSATSFKQVAAELLRTGATNVIGLFLAKTVSTFSTSVFEDFEQQEPEYDFDGLADYNEPPEPEEPDWW